MPFPLTIRLPDRPAFSLLHDLVELAAVLEGDDPLQLEVPTPYGLRTLALSPGVQAARYAEAAAVLLTS